MFGIKQIDQSKHQHFSMTFCKTPMRLQTKDRIFEFKVLYLSAGFKNLKVSDFYLIGETWFSKKLTFCNSVVLKIGLNHEPIIRFVSSVIGKEVFHYKSRKMLLDWFRLQKDFFLIIFTFHIILFSI